MATKKTQKNAIEYICNICDFYSCNKSDYSRHLQTKKHISNNSATFSNINIAKEKKYKCDNCQKEYINRTGLWRHNKKCIPIEVKNDKDDLIIQLLQQNQELHKSLIEISKEKSITNITNKNKTFNLNLFLNETCKDALNLTDFMNTIQLQLNDLENTAKEGYVSGISNIIIKELKNLDVHKRPIHCSDLKRETLYIKDNNAWEKENEEKLKIKQAIKEISNKNIKQIPLWLQNHPNFSKYNHPDNDEYLALISASMSGTTKEEQEDNINKIIKNLSKEVVIEK